MSETTKKVLLGIAAVVVGLWAIKIVLGLVMALVFQVLIPVAIIGAIGYGIYLAFGKKALGGGNRRTLP